MAKQPQKNQVRKSPPTPPQPQPPKTDSFLDMDVFQALNDLVSGRVFDAPKQVVETVTEEDGNADNDERPTSKTRIVEGSQDNGNSNGHPIINYIFGNPNDTKRVKRVITKSKSDDANGGTADDTEEGKTAGK